VTPAPSTGNGSAMRAAPLGVLFARDVGAMSQAAEQQSRITHLDPRCTAGAIAVAGATRLAAARSLIDRRAFLGEVAELTRPASAAFSDAVVQLAGWADLAPADASRRLHAAGLDPEYRNRWQGVSAFVIPSVVWSLYAFLHAPDDYWTCVCTAIAVGGDTDTMAAIAGAMAGARLGPAALPAGLVARLNDRGDWGAEALADLARRAVHLVGS
jgi:ADP-ribosylglycohydrolase